MKAETAVSADIPELTELRCAYLKEDLGNVNACVKEQLPAYFERHLGQDLLAYVLREDGQIVSVAMLILTEKPMSPSFINGRTGTLLNVYTRPAYRRKGCAKTVLTALLEEAKKRELCLIDLQATEDGFPLYQSLGFAENKAKYTPMRWRNPEVDKDKGGQP